MLSFAPGLHAPSCGRRRALKFQVFRSDRISTQRNSLRDPVINLYFNPANRAIGQGHPLRETAGGLLSCYLIAGQAGTLLNLGLADQTNGGAWLVVARHTPMRAHPVFGCQVTTEQN